MEIEVLLPVKNTGSLNEYVLAQRNFIERLSFITGTFHAFIATHEVIDTNKRKIITRPFRLSKIFKNPTAKAFVFAFCKN